VPVSYAPAAEVAEYDPAGDARAISPGEARTTALDGRDLRPGVTALSARSTPW